eukprot:Skav217202  [mRNA]  locus=scaffold3544:37234:41220:+ [translate_table: standard]
MFSKQSAERFEKDRLLEDPTPGPGAYGLPAAMEASERWRHGSTAWPWSDSSTNDLEKEPCHLSPLSPPCRTPTPARAVEKENRVPLSARAATPKKTPATPAPAAPATCWEGDSRRQTDLRLASRLDMVRGELRFDQVVAMLLMSLIFAEGDLQLLGLESMYEDIGGRWGSYLLGDDLRLKSKEAKESGSPASLAAVFFDVGKALGYLQQPPDRKIEDLSKKIEDAVERGSKDA